MRKDKKLEVTCGDLQVPLIHLTPTPNGFMTVCDKQANVDRFPTENARANLGEINLAPVILSELQRTLLVH